MKILSITTITPTPSRRAPSFFMGSAELEEAEDSVVFKKVGAVIMLAEGFFDL